MNESQLETFLTVAKYRSYSKAAEVLNVTQPTITSRIKALETILQCPLFKRIRHEIYLTKAGNMFIDYAKNILTYIQHSKEIVNLVKDPIIKVGFSPGYSYSFIINLLKAVKLIGGIDIQVIDSYHSHNLNEMFMSGEIDLIFTRDTIDNNPDIVSEYLFDNHLVLVLPSNHPLTNKLTPRIEDLNNETIISYKRNSPLWRTIDKKLISAQNIVRIEVDNNEMALKAIANGIGIGIIPELGIDKRYASEIKTLKIDEIYKIPNKVYVQYRKTLNTDGIAKKIIYSIINHKYEQV